MFLTRIGYGIIYFLDLIYEIIKSTVDVVFNKIMRRDINPVVIDVETVLERPVSQTILANSISLTPGTLSVDLDSENQIIKVAAISPRSKEEWDTNGHIDYFKIYFDYSTHHYDDCSSKGKCL